MYSRIQSATLLGRMLRLLTSLMVSRHTFRLVGIYMLSIGMNVRIWRVLIIFHICFIGALMTIARTIFTIMPKVIELSITPKVFSIERINARWLFKKEEVTRIQFLLRNFPCESVVILNKECRIFDLEVLRWLHHYNLYLVELFLNKREISPFSLPNWRRCREGSWWSAARLLLALYIWWYTNRW